MSELNHPDDPTAPVSPAGRIPAILKNDSFGRFFLTGFNHIQYTEKGTTRERSNVDTLYANLLLWKPLIHVLITRTLWDVNHMTLFTNYELKQNPVVYTFEEFVAEYNRIIQPIVGELKASDLHPNAKRPLTVADLEHFENFCTKGLGRIYVQLKTTYREDLARSIKAKMDEKEAKRKELSKS